MIRVDPDKIRFLVAIDTCSGLDLASIGFLSNNAFGVSRDSCLAGAHLGF
jgi:hypothetical protein